MLITRRTFNLFFILWTFCFFRCPICRKEVALINGDVKNFPKHNMIENLIRILTLNKDRDCKMCDGCNNKS